VVVIGGGDTAMDAARSAWRLGALEVHLVYRRERADMPAIPHEVDEALEEGVELRLLAAPKRLLDNGSGRVKALEVARTRLGEIDYSGRRSPVLTDEIETIDCDTVLLAIGEKVDSAMLKGFGLKMEKNGTLAVDPFTLQTSNPKIYAGGDLVSGASNVTNAMAFGKRAAAIIDRRLMGEDRFDQLWRKIEYQNTVAHEPDPTERQTCPYLDPDLRRDSFEEVALGLDKTKAVDEAGRCLRCDVKAGAIH
jgi:NADH-quinone oxidoreductase subunit F